ncbi:MAG: SdiA-regulated domain-containing protein, partial [Solirubrobacteraceae bacterium]|nr:SdiA-regulated domain-containing protein [Solirubrobacteraceae bacterium]
MSNPQRALGAPTRGRARLTLSSVALATAFAASAFSSAAATAAPVSSVDLSNYVRVGRYDLPEPTRTTAPAGNLLAQEASGVTYNPDTGTLFIVGDGGTSVTQVTKTGQFVDAMTLPAGGSSQNTEFYDTEGITYIGNGEFVMTEERDRQLVRFTYAPGTTLTRAQTKTVKLGTTVGNVGLEGLTDDPSTGDFIPVKETSPLGIFQTSVDFDAGTASNGSPTTVNSTDLFTPALAGVADFADIFALSNLPAVTGAEGDNLVIISQESGKVVEVTRAGAVQSSLTINADLDTTISVADQTHEGVTMDDEGNLYVVSENGGGSINFPQLWVYAPATQPNEAPTAVALVNRVASVLENTPTTSRFKVADVRVGDDGLGTYQLGVTGPDAASFEVDASGLYLKAGVTLDFETKTSYNVAVTA